MKQRKRNSVSRRIIKIEIQSREALAFKRHATTRGTRI
jgi:hypothetical protein